MALLKIPYIFSEILPLTAMLAMFLMNYTLGKKNELVAIWSNGISIFRMLLPISLSCLTIGIIATTLLNPVSTYLYTKYEKIESKLIDKKTSNLVISDMGIIISEQINDQRRVYIVKSLNLSKKEIRDITILETDHASNFIQRINARKGSLEDGRIVLENISLYDKDGKREQSRKLEIDTELSINNFVQGLTDPIKISFWNLHEAIENLQRAGLPYIKHQAYYYKLLFRPLLMVAFIFLASCFISRDNRSKNQFQKVALGLFIGFGTFLTQQILNNILIFNGFDPRASIALLTLIIILLSSYSILHLRMD